MGLMIDDLFYVKLRGDDLEQTLIQCLRDTGPASKTVGKYFANTGSTPVFTREDLMLLEEL